MVLTVRAEPRTYGNWRAPRTAGLGPLGLLGTIALFTGIVIGLVVMMFFGWIPALGIAGVLVIFLALVSLRDRHGQTAAQKLGGRIAHARARRSGAHLYRSGPLGRTPWGTYQLPGMVAPTQLSEWHDSYERPFALVRIPATGHYSVTIRCEPNGESLVDVEQVDAWVAGWGAWLNALGDEPGLVAAAVTVESAPDTGARLRREVETNLDPAAPAVARQVLQEIIATYPAGSAQLRAWISLTFSGVSRGTGRRRDAEQMGLDLASRLPGLTQSLHATGAGAARPATAQDLCEIVRAAYDPAAAALIDAARIEGHASQLRWHQVGPTSATAHRGHYEHDGAVSCSWVMSSAPRGVVQSGVLGQLLAPHRDLARKRVTIIYRPLDSAASARIAEQDRRDADFRVSSQVRPSARAVAEQRSTTATATEEARGHHLINFGVVVTATVADVHQVADAVAAVDNLSATARLQLRRAWGAQDSTFVAGLPIGLVLPAHQRIPAELREAL